ncbi:stromal membrane-associated protein 1 isoform X2 [Diachasmimorpha longicaudata]|uniref:stromal membrane-associated protein 1 isoform X2 n=1 Tax=Diachasmimorpha longicaudata TaxID=58733 RepID=UPI0030B89EC8
MTSRFEKERVKQIQDKCQDLLTQMLRDEDNKYCVDCDAKGPRWASWNLGIFLCIRCAGIHRNLGVHISKVKSVNLDTWTPEQVVSLQQMGNSRARAVYEANLPDTFRRPQTDCSLESFIRAKYEHKKYIAREWVPPTPPKVNWDKELDDEAEKQRRRKKEGSKSSTTQSQFPSVKKPEVVPQLPKPRSSVSPKPSRASNNGGATLDLLGLDGPTNQTTTNGSGSGDDVFSSFLSAAPTASPAPKQASTNGTIETSTTTASKADEDSFFNQPAPTTQEKSKMTKDSILALYGTPSQQSVFGVPSGIYNQQALPQYTQPIQNVGSFGQIVPGQMPIAGNQMNVNGIGLSNPLGGNMQMGAGNGAINSGIAMQTQMSGVTSVGSQMIQMGQTPVPSNNGWSGMLAQNIQPAPGSNPFVNLGTQAPVNSTFVTQLPQQMSQMSLGGLGKPPPTALPGQTLSSNLWQ